MDNKEVYERCLKLLDNEEECLYFSSKGEKGIPYNRLTICDLLVIVSDRWDMGGLEEEYPEIFRQMPIITSKGRSWWPIRDRNSRRTALIEAIKLCH